MIKIGIKDLATFVCQTGDLTTEFFSNKDLENGTKVHKLIQSKYNEDSKAEVYIKKEINFLGKDILLHGFIDGVLNINDELIIEEIKSTTQEIDEFNPDLKKEYLAQLKVYGYLYALENNIDRIHLRLTYVSIVDYNHDSIDYYFDMEELEEFTFDLLEQYMYWLSLQEEASIKKQHSIETVKFPFANMRPGQRDMMRACFQIMNSKDILYVVAPTGIGKTMATMFSSIKTLKENEKLFYLTAKGSGKKAPLQAIKLLAKQGLKIKTIVITAKKKICNACFGACNPDDCPFAKQFFDKLREATLDIFENNDIFDEETILSTANKYQICAFEFSLYLSYFCDIVIADYNYVFDPRAHLVRYFDDDTYTPKVLVDEAHNLISRSKDMYSAMLTDEDLRKLRRLLTGYKPSIRNVVNKAIEQLESYQEVLAEKALHIKEINDLDFVVYIKQIISRCDEIFEEAKKGNKIANKDEVMDIYFKLLEYSAISDYFGPTHRLLIKKEKDIISIQMLCMDASDFILNTIEESIKSIVFFSATLTPFNYHSNLLTKGKGKFLELESPFDPNNLDIIINNRISTKYKSRTESVDYIIESIETLTNTHSGNYIVFFPSYQYMNMVLECIDNPNYLIVTQKSKMSEDERNEIIELFNDTTKCKVGFFVMGGIFSEGLDFIGDSLNGVIIVGVGLPLYCDENNLLKEYFDIEYQDGFEYAYTYPGFTKVVQAVGRVIRSETDRGVAILIDERFTYSKYLELMPKHWKNKKVITTSYNLKREIIDFYNKK